MIELGNKAPYFEGLNQAGKTVSLEDYKGSYLVLYFYPKDNTPGCTRESIGFSEKKAAFQAKNTKILGVSKDSVKSHQQFCEKQSLMIDLLSDESGKVVEDYGVWQEKKNYGKTYMGLVRTTYLIDPEGQIKARWKNVKVDGHVDKVFEAI